MRLPDVNVLVHAGNPRALQHGAARDWLVAAGQAPRGTLGLPWIVLLGFIRLSTRPGIYSKPLSVDAALAAVRQWLAAPAAVIVHAGDRHFQILSELLTQVGTAGNLTTDAHIAALAIENGAIVASFDRDFDRFAGVSFELLT